MKRTTAVLTLSAALLAAPAASAEQTPLGISSDRLDVAVTSDGAAHVAYLDGRTLKVCRIAAGASACEATAAAEVGTPGDQAVFGSPIVLASGTRVTALIRAGNGAGARTFATTSATGLTAASYSASTLIATVNAEDAAMSSDGTRVLLTSQEGMDGYLTVSSAPLPGGVPAGGAVLGTGSATVYGVQIAPRPNGQPIALVDGVTPGGTGEFLYGFTGDPAQPTQVNDKSKWTGPTGLAVAGAEQNGRFDLGAGNGALWLGYNGLGTDVLLRKWDDATGAFGTPVRPDCVAKRYGSGVQEAPDVAIAPGGDTLTAYVSSDGTNQHLGYIRGNADGTAFSAYQELTTPVPRIQDVEIAADASGGGIVVWTDDSNSGGPIRFARLPATTFAACPAPQGSGGGTTTPPVVKPPVTTPPTKTPKQPALSSVVSGLPSAKQCVSKRSFKIRLRNPKGTRIVRGTIKVDGKTKAVRKGKRVRARINLKGLPRGRYTVKITLKLADGRTLRYTRKYRTCTPGKKKRR